MASAAVEKMAERTSRAEFSPSRRSVQIALNQAQIDQLLEDARQSLQMSPEQLDRLRTFARESGLLDELKREGLAAWILPPEERSSVVAYLNRIAEIPFPRDSREPVSLMELLVPVFELARERTDAGQKPVAENRAAFLALALFSSGVDLSLALGEDAFRVVEPKIKPQTVGLLGRQDLTQHFLSSAALALTGGADQAGRLGLKKELADARGGSGFSFADLAANRAGMQLAGSATDSESAARLFQTRLSEAKAESDIMPSVDSLPEGLSEAEFVSRYHSAESRAFLGVLEDIDARIGACPVYRLANQDP